MTWKTLRWALPVIALVALAAWYMARTETDHPPPGGAPPESQSDRGHGDASTQPAFPRLANYFLGNPAGLERDLARWDLLVFPPEQPDAARQIKALNPRARIIPYRTAQEAYSPSEGPFAPDAGFSPSWWLTHSDGTHVTGWEGRWLVNVSSAAPPQGGRRWADHLSDWVFRDVWQAGGGVWDGIFYDNAWATVDWKASNLDLDRNGVDDFQEHGAQWVNDRWREGMLELMRLTREKLGPKAIIIGNGPLPAAGISNGRLFESFPDEWNPYFDQAGWLTAEQDYWRWHEEHFGDLYYVVNVHPPPGFDGERDYRLMRFGLASTLLGNGYYAYDEGVDNHAQVWWYDEYSVDLATGRATDDASRKGYLGWPLGSGVQLKNGVWRRDFDHGIALVNPTDAYQRVELERPFARIAGRQDPTVNDGAVVSSAILPAHDGLILLRTPSDPAAGPGQGQRTSPPIAQPSP